jgi:HPt (histidine-containing phosphotransfer) domain-containing protein
MQCAVVRSKDPVLTTPAVSESSSAPASAGLPAAGVLDGDALARLQELDPTGKAGLVARVLATYTNSLQRHLAELQAARRNADVQGQRHVVHTLKSSSASVGALKVSTLCGDIERQLRDGPTEALEPQFEALAAEAERLLVALRQAATPNP